MTTFEEPQPQSRRAARLSQRDTAAELPAPPVVAAAELPAPPVVAAAELPAPPVVAAEALPVRGRRSATNPVTQVSPIADPTPALVAPAAVERAEPVLDLTTPDQHLPTRRELRAMRTSTAEADVAAVVAPTTEPTAEPQAWPFAPAPTQPSVESDSSRGSDDAPDSQWTAPVGHWSIQADTEDELQPSEPSINRTVSSGTITTSALVLGAIPEGSDIRGPLTDNGEIILTGSIDLPHAYSSTGATAQVEDADIDAFFDLDDADLATTDSQPVRAISAVSTQNSGQGLTTTQKPQGTKALTVLVISAASMAVVVVGLLIAVFALHIF